MKRFPFPLLRVNLTPFREMIDLRAVATVELLEKKINLYRDWETLIEELSKQLYLIIQNEKEQAIQQHLLQLRRNIFNKKKLNVKNLPEDLQESIRQYIYYYNELFILESTIRNAYESDLEDVRKAFKQKISNTIFQNGLSLSSHALLRQCDAFLEKAPEKFRKKERQTELGLIQYFSRMATKTSPFAGFTSIGSGKWEKGEVGDLSYEGDWNIQVKTALNNQLFRYLKRFLLGDLKYLSKLKVKLNPSLIVEENEYVFLLNNENKEAFQHIPRSPVLDWMIGFLEGKEIVFEGLVEAFCEAVEADEMQINQYVFQLFEYGFLEVEWGASGTDPEWSEKLLTALPDETIFLPIRNFIIKSGEALKTFKNKISKERIEILKEIYNDFKILIKRETVEKKEAEEGFKRDLKSVVRFSPEQIFYEDSVLEGQFTLSKNKWDKVLNVLNALTKNLSPLFEKTNEAQKIETYFKTKYQQPVRLSLLKFYEDYFKYKKEAEEEAKIKGQDLKNWKQQIQSCFTGMESKNINIDDILKINSGKGFSVDSKQQIFRSSLVQPFHENENLKVVLHHLSPGYGRLSGRFLYLLPQEVTHTFREWNEGLSSEEFIYAENKDASYFNANIHPALMPHEISTPGGHHALPENQRLNIGDIAVEWDGEKARLFYEKTNQKIYVFDLGLESLKSRSPLYNLLTQFNPVPRVGVEPLREALYEGQKFSKEKITVLPRIYVENIILIQRKTWMIPRGLLPLKEKTDNDLSYFSKIYNFIVANNLPKQVFIYVHSKDIKSGNVKEGRAIALKRDDYKPQYMDFENPILVRLFGKLVKRVPVAMKMTEVCPSEKNGLSFQSDYSTNEILLQWLT